MTAFQFVDTASALSALIPQLQNEPELALDTEFMREQTYYPRLCLIQIATPTMAYAIDPLAIEDLSEISALFANPSIRKVLHAARQDVEVLLTRLKELPLNLFDTQVAAALCGMPPQIGYGELVHKTLDVQLDKAHSRTDWAQRPLSAEQLQYAAEDVHSLPPLRRELQAKLEELGRLKWFEFEMERLAEERLYRPNPADAWQRLRGIDPQDERRLATAKALAQWREERAMSRNRPRGWILADEAVYELIRTLPHDMETLNQARFVPPGVVKKAGEELLAVIASTAELPVNPNPSRRFVPPDIVHQKQLKAMTALVRTVAEELNIVPEVLATRRDLLQVIGGRADAQPLKGWRREVFGEKLLSSL